MKQELNSDFLLFIRYIVVGLINYLIAYLNV